MKDDAFGLLLLIAVVSWSLLMIYIGIRIEQDIPAIDVYRGLTTLEITYRDSIPLDSVVVYKN